MRDQVVADHVLRDVVLAGHFDRVLAQRERALPEAGLTPGERGQHGDRRDAENARDAPVSEQGLDRPHEHHEHAEQRHVRVAVGHRLTADLHEPDDWDERARIEEPADEDPRPSGALRQRESARDEEDERPEHDRHEPEAFRRKRVVDRETGRE